MSPTLLVALPWALLIGTGIFLISATGGSLLRSEAERNRRMIKVCQVGSGMGAMAVLLSLAGLVTWPLAPVADGGDGSAPGLGRVLVQARGGNEMAWDSLPESGGARELHLELVGLDRVTGPEGTWTICVGLPGDGLELARGSDGWLRRPEEDHPHPESGCRVQRSQAIYRACFLHITVGSAPQAQAVRIAPLRLRATRAGDYQLGLRWGRGIETRRHCLDGPISTVRVRRAKP